MERFRGYPVCVRRFELAGRVIELLGPANFEALIDEPDVAVRFEKDEYLPYWAEFWPACLLAADAVAAWGPRAAEAAPLRVLELGCGLGLVGLVAAALGHEVIVSDYDEDALAFVCESARRNGLPAPQTRYVDWRETYADLRVDRIVAAEILYELRSLRPIACFVAGHLAAGGEALISDANRQTADGFADVAREAGLRVAVEAVERENPMTGERIRGRVFRLWREGEGRCGREQVSS